MPQPDFDVYEDMSWTDRAAYGIYGIALDHADVNGKKNLFIDTVHQRAIRQALVDSGRHFSRALDFGCGGGRLLPLLREYAGEVYGADRTPACLDIARARDLIPPQRLVCWREGPLPFVDGYFDLVLCVYVLLTGAALDVLPYEISRVCQRGGIAVVLEQTDNGRGLTLDHYRSAFAEAGFRLQTSRAIRRSHGSRAMRWATRSTAPVWLTRLMAGWELAGMRGQQYDEHTPNYFDYLFVLVKN